MRIIQLTAGTGSFYCGTCIRDNALVTAFRRLGDDAMMVPMYLAPMLDEPSNAVGLPVFYGGINVFLQQISGVFRRTPRWMDQIFDSPGMLKFAAKRAGMTQASDLGELTVSTLRGEEGRQTKELDRLVEWLVNEGKPDVVCLSNALLIGLARRIKSETGAAVVCTLQGEDSFLDSLPQVDRDMAWATISERAKDVDAFIAVSNYHADTMQKRANLSSDKVHVVYNGINLDGFDSVERVPGPPTIGYLARMCATKGLETLVEAFLILRKRGTVEGVRLRIAGAETDADKPFVARLKSRLTNTDVEFHPNIDREQKVRFLQSLSVLSVPATYGESFGLYIIEGLAAGVPFVQPRHAVFPELEEVTAGGVLCDPDDPESLASELEALLLNPEEARRLGEQGRKAVQAQFSMECMAKGVREVLVQVTNGVRV